MNFLEQHRVTLTPLSPIHIGCGEDFEPTNYVIDGNLLYGFDPVRAVLPKEAAQNLGSLCVKANPIMEVQKFFQSDHKKAFISQTNLLVAVMPSVSSEYKKKLKDGDFNKFILERHAHQVYNRQLPYIPGSSLKGALRTSWMNSNLGRKNCFETKEQPQNPMRLLKVADLLPADHLAHTVLTAHFVYKDGLQHTKKLSTYKECILPGQYRGLSGEIVLHHLGDKGNEENTPASDLRPDLCKIMRYCKDYHRNQWDKEAKLCEKDLLDHQWREQIESLLDGELQTRLDSGYATLVRIGRYGGAESKTFPEQARIKIHKNDYRKETTTCWRAKINEKWMSFGWAILEIDPQDDLPELQEWCAAQAETRVSFEERYEHLRMLKEEASLNKAQLQAQQTARRLAEQAAEKAAYEAEQRRASMTAAQCKIEEFTTDLQKRATSLNGRKEKPNGAEHQKASALAKQAHENAEWTPEDKKAVAEAIEEWLPKVVAVDMKDVRKKLKLSVLKGNPG